MKALRVKPEFVSLLKTGNFDTFSVSRFRDAYLQLTGDNSKSKNLTSQLVKRHLRKLEEYGVLERVASGKLHPIVYRIKDLTRLNSGPTVHQHPGAKSKRSDESLPEEVILTLKVKLSKYRTDLLSAAGALEEYEAIAQIQPRLKVAIQKKYDQTREEYAKTLGKVRAIESLLDPKLSL
ncbi:hypothetical protein MO867_19890 [Microbulbifer sp. OS29]|uniref:Uncharacterized protein n=1 Tax=Microbulbifer okhotskensis TaxID=2926617 RepID=A0A9X2ERS0_9GAMM|nr:hypothetical protein [Microbulbifer okhotskensis]MCO1336595.1 hypothetical protein [Microbulbifer okhotskensis]